MVGFGNCLKKEHQSVPIKKFSSLLAKPKQQCWELNWQSLALQDENWNEIENEFENEIANEIEKQIENEIENEIEV